MVEKSIRYHLAKNTALFFKAISSKKSDNVKLGIDFIEIDRNAISELMLIIYHI